MKEFITFVLPIAVALVGARIGRWVLGEQIESQFGPGFRFAYGLAVGILLFSQSVLLCAIVGFNGAPMLAWLALLWGAAEVVLLAMKLPTFWKTIKFQAGHWWLLLLIPLFYSWWVLGRLSTLEGTMEFDANAFWVFRAKILYYEQGHNLINTIRLPNLGYAHMDYPWLEAGIYTLGYGVMGGVDEFVNKVWPFWMMVGLCIGVLSIAKIWTRPHPLPVAAVTILFFLPATLKYIRWEGGTTPMVFYVSMVALLVFNAMSRRNSFAVAAAMPVIAGCAVTKFEGVIFGFFCLCALLPFSLKNKWLTNKLIWKSVAAGLLCLLPFVWYRLLKPDTYELNSWWKAYTAWPIVLPCYLRALLLYIPGRFFNGDFFHWRPSDNGHVTWDGHWIGMSAFVNEQVSVLPWLLLILLVLTFWKKRERLALLSLSMVMLAMMFFFTLILTCLAYTESDVPGTIEYAYVFVNWNSSDDIGRYCYPFFTAWFLVTASLWFTGERDAEPQIAQSKKNPLEPPARRPKRS